MFRAKRIEERTLLERLEAFEGNLELVLVEELGGVVEDLDAQKRDDRHCGGVRETKFELQNVVDQSER